MDSLGELTPDEDAGIAAIAEGFARAIEAYIPRVDVLAIDLELGHKIATPSRRDGATNERAPLGAVEALSRAPNGRERLGHSPQGGAA